MNGDRNEAHSSGVSWAAVFAGAFVTAALSLALLALGTGIGLSAASPWSAAGSASRIGRTAIGWLVLTQLIASAVGGYLAGRLRTRWVSIHTHEVYFRDTAHGFLVWAVSLVMTAAFLASAATSVAGVQATNRAAANAYFSDTLLRAPAAEREDAARRDEITAIFAKGLAEGGLSTEDRSYLARVVARRAGISEAEAATRVDTVFGDAQQSADRARKALAHSMYWTFVAFLIGAFSASVAATIGGKERDRVVVV